MITVRYFAGAAEAAGTEEESLEAGTVGALLDAMVTAHPALSVVLPRCSLLVDGVRTDECDVEVGADARVDVLPPFAGG